MFLAFLLTFATSLNALGTDTSLLYEKTPITECGIPHGGPTVQQIKKPGNFMEGLYWDSSIQKLLFVDKIELNVNWYDVSTGVTTTIHINETGSDRFSVFVPVEGAPKKYVLATERDLYLLTFLDNNDSHPYTIKHLMSVVNDTTKNKRFNKGSVSPNHNLWLGVEHKTVSASARGLLELLKVNIGVNVTVMDNRFEDPAGIGWNKENTLLYVVDDKAGQVYQYNYDIETSTISNKTVVFDLNDYSNIISGDLSGIAVDTEGELWIGVYKGISVIRVDPKKKTLEEIISVPATDIISATWGGKDLNILFVGSTNKYLPKNTSEPNAGNIYAITGTGRRGFPTHKVYVPPNLLN